MVNCIFEVKKMCNMNFKYIMMLDRKEMLKYERFVY